MNLSDKLHAWRPVASWRFAWVAKTLREADCRELFFSSVAKLASYAILGLALSAQPASGQTNERIYEGLDFRFVTPGARAIGMGVTFVGLADDATAAASNPAGLSNLQHLEFSLEIIRSNSSQEYLVNNQVQGVPCSPQCNVFKTYGNTSWSLPSFASVAVPIRDFTLSAFTNSEQKFRRTFQLEPRFVPPTSTPLGSLGASAQTAEAGRLDVSVRNWGAGGAWVLRPWISLGASVVLSHLNLESEGSNIEGSSVDSGVLRQQTHTSASSTRPSVFGGVLARPFRGLALGLGYYGGTTFHMRTDVRGTFANPGSRSDRCLNQSFGQPLRVCDPQQPIPTDYVVPSRLALGASYQVSGRLTILGEAARVQYSALLTRNFQIIDFRFTNEITRDNFYFNDVNEYHAGVEYRWPYAGHVLAVRVGGFTDPSHTLRFRVTDLSSGANAVENFVFNTNTRFDTRVGKTFGFGLTFGNRLQADAAASLEPGLSTFVVSLVRRFL